MAPTVSVTPELATFDQKVRILVKDLPPFSPVTIDAFLVHFKMLYVGIGKFYADENGQVEVGTRASFGGTYRGVKAMGLFTSMITLPSNNVGTRFLLKGDASEILKFEINVWKGHLSQDDIHRLHIPFTLYGTYDDGPGTTGLFIEDNFICKTLLRRTYLDPAVRRIAVRADHKGVAIRGTMFMPPGPGPFPGIIDNFGGVGGCVEIRAALLAKHGFATLALAYFGYQDLPYKSVWDYPITYFDSAIDWLLEQPQISKFGVGITGVCLGAQNAMLAGMRNSRVKATVCFNGTHFMMSDPDQKTNPIKALYNGLVENIEGTGMLELLDGKVRVRPHAIPKLVRPMLTYPHDNPILFIVGEKEQSTHARQLVSEVRQQLTRSGKNQHWVEVIEGQGHLIEPPYAPMCTSSRDVGSSKKARSSPQGDTWIYLNNLVTNWGGDRNMHEEGQVKAWQMLVDFMKRHVAAPVKAKL